MANPNPFRGAARLLARLVACPSVNPSGRPVSDPSEGEGAMADLLASIVAPWGAEVRKTEVAPGRFNFVARFAGAGPRSLLLEAHADTVPVAGMTIPPFDPAIRDGRLYGRGSCDTKGPMAAVLLAIRSVLDAGPPPATVYFAATADEEYGALGAHRLVADRFRPDAAVVAEPTGLAIVRVHKGAYRFRIATLGRAAHSSQPSRGASAISKMVRVIQEIEGPMAAELAGRGHAVLGAPTISVGVIRGGTQVNVIPDRCQIEVDRRTLPGETRDGLAAPVREMLEALRAQDPEFRYEFEETQWFPALEGDPGGSLVRLVGAALEQVIGRADLLAAPWASNAGIFQEAGIPSIALGPGDVGQAHTAGESIELVQVQRAAEVYAEIIRRFGM